MSEYMTPEVQAQARAAGDMLQRICLDLAVKCGRYHDPHTGEKMMLIVSEIAGAMEAHRKGLMDDKLTHRSGVEVKMADAVIRIADLCGKHSFDLGEAIAEKLVYNENRLDHKPENSIKAGGKAY